VRRLIHRRGGHSIAGVPAPGVVVHRASAPPAARRRIGSGAGRVRGARAGRKLWKMGLVLGTPGPRAL